MPGAQIHRDVVVERTATRGLYHAKIQVDISGDWNMKISYDGPHGKGETTFQCQRNSDKAVRRKNGSEIKISDDDLSPQSEKVEALFSVSCATRNLRDWRAV